MRTCSLTVLALACSTSPEPPVQPFELRVQTFNAALAPVFAELALERAEPVIGALASDATKLDLLCVQEFWVGEHWDALRQAVASELPHTLRPAPRASSGTCGDTEFASLASCLQTACPTASGAELVACAQASCAEAVQSLSPGCLGCIINHVADDVSGCVGAPEPSDPAIYGGAFDVGLASRFPILESDVSELSSYFVRAAVLYARVDVPGAGPVHTFCTHLGSPLDIVPYAGKFGSWHDEQRQQILELQRLVREKTHGSGRVLVLGDMNTGPSQGSLQGEWPDNYQALSENGLENPYLTEPDAKCSWCPENTFHPNASPSLIDHIFTSGFDDATANTARTALESVELGSADNSRVTHLSDHFGLRLTLKRASP